MSEKKMNSEIKRSNIKPQVIFELWGKSAGRCQICNIPLYKDPYWGESGNYAENAHIHAVSAGGPRHKSDMTQEEVNNIENLMLLCPQHHKFIDNNPCDYGNGLLLEIKANHEKRIQSTTSISYDQETRMVSYITAIDGSCPEQDETLFRQAVIKSKKYPKQTGVIKLNMSFGPYECKKDYYEQKATELETTYKEWSFLIHEASSVSLFPLGLQPLLIKLGYLLTDQHNIDVYQCHRDGHKWAWKDCDDEIDFLIDEVTLNETTEQVALVLDLSAKVIDTRISNVVPDNTPIIHLTISEPTRGFVTSPTIQNQFVEAFRQIMERIKTMMPRCRKIFLFPVMPASLNVRLGMDYMPKTDPPITIYDQDPNRAGFFETISIGG